MYGHECESDEDCEVYFLKPVNEYNIVDKIKEANKELFAGEAAEDGSEEGTTAVGTNRKVSFALNLEDYEPAGELEKLAQSETDDSEQETKSDFAAALKFPAIDEQEEVDEIILEQEESKNMTKTTLRANSEASDTDTDTKPQELNDLEAQNLLENAEDLEELEEICEEIITMDMEEPKTSSNDSQQQRNKMLKQATFDHDDDSHDDQEDDDTSDIKSLTDPIQRFNSKAVDDSEDLADNEEDDDDDQLSIIVASYISDDYEKHALLVDSDFRRKHKFIKPKNSNSFTKRFSFRRKSNNASTTCNSDAERHMPPPGVTDLKLSYKTCCEYRHAVQEKLPKYTGYLSEYGLTREQLDKREEKWQQKQRFILEKSLQANDQEMRKMQDNERAFTTWLKQKMRFPINKTRNMFDVKFSVGGGCASGSAVRNRCNSGKIK